MISILEKINLIKTCEICNKHIATKSKISFSGKKIRVCEKCFKIIKI